MEQRTRIYIVGPSSTGKTTLCNALAQRLGLKGPQIVTEVARRVITALGLSRDNIGLLDMQKAIMLAHLEQERGNEDSSAHLSDRSAVDPIAYAIFTAANPEDAQHRKQALVNLPEFQRALPRYRNSLFILLTPVREWMEDDGFRHVGDEAEILAIFRNTLSELGIRYRELGPEMGFLPERTAFVLSLATILRS
ncbi:AAA domain-containing protein [Mycena sanguinolenta]|nr:AAA domain-containing protein [Mycena sanguinolenta]